MTAQLLFNAHPGNSQGGGAVIKLRKIRDFMRARGHRVDLYDQWTTTIEHHSIYHHFSMFPVDLPMYRLARASGIKICVEAMYFASWAQVLSAPSGFSRSRRLLRIGRYAQRRFAPRTTPERMILDLADSVMVNSEFEKANLVRDFRINPAKVAVCYNGVDTDFAGADPALFVERFGVTDFVLVTGIFEERKNQLGLIRAMKGLDIPLVMIGGTPPVHRWYRDLCQAEAGRNVLFLDEMDHDDELFRSAYAACKVLALPSWHETTGKSGLEAGLLAKNVVMTTFAPAAPEYFGDFAFYVDPRDVSAIRRAVHTAMDTGPATELQARIARRFKWNTVLADREKHYLALLQAGGVPGAEPTQAS